MCPYTSQVVIILGKKPNKTKQNKNKKKNIVFKNPRQTREKNAMDINLTGHTDIDVFKIRHINLWKGVHSVSHLEGLSLFPLSFP